MPRGARRKTFGDNGRTMNFKLPVTLGRTGLRVGRLGIASGYLALAVERRSGHNKAAVALANKLARIAWAVWKSGPPQEARPRAA
jgi:hypothetical protein